MDEHWKNPAPPMYHVLGFKSDRIGSGYTREPDWYMFRAFAWLLLQRDSVVHEQHLEADAPLGCHMHSVMSKIRSELRPLFRFVHQPRVNVKQKRPYADADASGSQSQEDQWMMLRYPWYDRMPNEDEMFPMSSVAIPPKELDAWQKVMMRRAFGKDTFAKTLLMSGFSANVCAYYKHQDEDEHRTQDMVGEMMEDSDAMMDYEKRQELKHEVKKLTKGKQSRRLQIKKKDLHAVCGSINWEQHRGPPRGIPARVALCLLPSPPPWLLAKTCIGAGKHSLGPLGRCSLCSALLCRCHAVLLGIPLKGDEGQRMGGGHLRCAKVKECDARIRVLMNALPHC